MATDRGGAGPLERAWRGLTALNLNALGILVRRGAGPAASYVTYGHRLVSGFGLPWPWTGLAWRGNLTIPQVEVQKVFPEIDFVHSPDLLYPFPRDLGVLPHELMILAKVVQYMKPRCVVEFGTAEGRTALNVALHLPPEGEVVTLDFPPIPGQNDVGFFYWESPLKAKIKQVFCGVDAWDSSAYKAGADIVFCDACDQPEGLRAETAQAFRVIKPGGVIFRHDYGTAAGPTLFWNELAKELPVKHLLGTTMLCLRLDDPQVYAKTQEMLASGRFESAS